MKDPNMVEEREHQPKKDGRIKINVGGTVFETTVFTLTRLDNNVLSALVSNRWKQSSDEEIFVDRNPTYFGKVLDYLRDGENFIVPTDFDARQCLRREADFYNLPDLAKMCSPGLHVGDWVMWKEDAVEAYWKFFARRVFRNLKFENLPNCPWYEYSGRKTCAKTCCADCGAKVSLVAQYVINYEEWIHVKHQMRFMKGFVEEVKSRMCCTVKWDNGWFTHFPQSAKRLATSQ